MPYTQLGDIHRLEFNDKFNVDNVTLILTMDNLLVFHGNLLNKTLGGAVETTDILCTLPEKCRPVNVIRIPVVLQGGTSYVMNHLVIRPSGDITLGSRVSRLYTIFLDGVVVSVSDAYYHYTKDTPFDNTCPTTYNAIQEAYRS